MREHSEKTELQEALNFEAGGEASKVDDPTVLSCGGIYIPYQELPSDILNWQRVVHLASQDISARMFEMTLDDESPLKSFLRKEFLN